MRATLFAIAASALGLGAAHGEPATPQGAKAMADSYAAWFSPAVLEKGILSVAPQGDDYIVTFDLAKALTAMEAPKAVTVSPLSYRVTPTLGGGWFAHGASLPSLSFGSPDKDGGTIAFDGFRFDGLFDPEAPDFFRAKFALGELKVDVRSKTGKQTQHLLMIQSGDVGEMRVRSGEGEGAVDVRITQSLASGNEKSTVAGEDEDETPAFETHRGVSTSESVVNGLRAAAFGDIWRFLVAHAQSGPPPRGELKPLLAALAPLWKEMSGQGDAQDVAVSFPGGSLSIKSADEVVKLSGLAAHSTAALALAVKELSIDLDAAPEWAKAIWPLTLAIQFESSIDGLDHAAEIALADAEWLKSGALGEEAKAAILQTLMGGHPRVVMNETRLASPLVEATFAGEALFDGSAPQAHAKITADNLDKVMEMIAKVAEDEPDARQFLYLATFVRGLARSEDGRLAWDLEFVPPNALKVNGQVFPPK